MNPFEVYRQYLSLKNHFTKDNYDHFKYCGKSKTTIQSFYKRKDRFFFERLSRQKTDNEIINFFVANFVMCSDPETLWIGEISKTGETQYEIWKKNINEIVVTFEKDSKLLFCENDFKDIFNCSKGHPLLLKKFLGKQISLETMIIYDMIFSYSSKFDEKLSDPVWEMVSRKIKKYTPFLNINMGYFKKLLVSIIPEAK